MNVSIPNNLYPSASFERRRSPERDRTTMTATPAANAPPPAAVPLVYLVDDALRIVAIAGHNADDPATAVLSARWLLDIEPLARRLIADSDIAEGTVALSALAADTFVRVLPLQSSFVGYAVFVERRRSRASLRATCVALGLSRRETEVMELVVTGKRNSLIAQLLEISAATVETHVRNVAVKLGCSSRAAMIARTLSA